MTSAAALRLLDATTRRAELHEAAGVVLAWGGDNRGDVLERFFWRHSKAEREAEVARVNAVVDAAAIRRADPDWRD